MSFFIHNENQNLLWNVINKSDYFKRIFHSGSQYNPNIWFRNVIQRFHEEKPVVTKNELNSLNKLVIGFMIDNLKSISQQPIVIDRDIPIPPPPYVEKKEDIYQKQFLERQKQYESLLNKPLPPKPEFGDNIKDEAIPNMDELIQAQRKMREEDIKSIMPPLPEENIKIEEIKVENTMDDMVTIKLRLARVEEELLKFSEILQILQLNNSTLKNT
jgi:hypothetical protein